MTSLVMEELKSFGIQLEHAGPNGITLSDLLDEQKCLSFLHIQMKAIKAPNLLVTASMISKRFAFLIVSSTLYSMGKFNCALRIPIKECVLSMERKLCIQEEVCKWEELNNMEREQWRENILSDLFSNYLTPVIDMLKKTSCIPSSILWENVAIRINSIYRKTLENEKDPTKIECLNSDFHFLKNAGGDLFNLENNPLTNYLKIGEELKFNPFRKTCCMYYKLEEDKEGIGYCSICPLKK